MDYYFSIRNKIYKLQEIHYWYRVYRCYALHNELDVEWAEINAEIWVRNPFHIYFEYNFEYLVLHDSSI